MMPDADFRWQTRDRVNAFYSGHSLSDGIPEAVAKIAAARGQTLQFGVQSQPYSLLRERTGDDGPSELDHPSRLPPGQRYDALVVTERHDLPFAAAREGTATHLADIARRALRGNPDANVFFYHTWLAIDRTAPQPWIAYERNAQRLWECVASRANLDLALPSPRIRVLPGGAALTRLVENLWNGSVPDLEQMSPAARVGLLFADNVHLSAVGRAYMGMLHYSVLFGQIPAGSPPVAPLTDRAKVYLEQLAYDEATSYAKVANAGAQRNLEACREFAVEMCSAGNALPPLGWQDRLKRPYKTWACRRTFVDAHAEGNPFRRP